MSPYLLLKTLHILTATLLFGTGLGSAYYAWQAWRSGQLQVIATTFRHLVSADWLFIATSAVFQPLSGLGLAYWAGWPLAQGWLLWSLGLYVFAGLCWLPVVWLQIRVRDLAEAATAAGTVLPPRAFFYMRWWFALGWPAFLAFLAIFWLMVNKPL
ncbi:DUF2269 family protein [Pseudomonas citronellolis]|uniref:DUF2269 family protein n=1 Tax=Pseudomonas citronellolis TaxID=53408 RepID=UPI000718586D|nr:DUF2269 domain-containing protein [Pseudomonas citronellolis]KRV73459.1 hypothetical protein AO742_04345 [Pseudomonas citronellolis]KRW79357.1 hypothetical protein AO738_28255 [Pseudomonas citronellolis]